MSGTSIISRAAPRQPAYKRSGPPALPATPAFFRVTDLKARWGLSGRTIYRMIERLGLKTGRIGKAILISADDVARIDAAIMSGSLADFQTDTDTNTA